MDECSRSHTLPFPPGRPFQWLGFKKFGQKSDSHSGVASHWEDQAAGRLGLKPQTRRKHKIQHLLAFRRDRGVEINSLGAGCHHNAHLDILMRKDQPQLGSPHQLCLHSRLPSHQLRIIPPANPPQPVFAAPCNTLSAAALTDCKETPVVRTDLHLVTIRLYPPDVTLFLNGLSASRFQKQNKVNRQQDGYRSHDSLSGARWERRMHQRKCDIPQSITPVSGKKDAA